MENNLDSREASIYRLMNELGARRAGKHRLAFSIHGSLSVVVKPYTPFYITMLNKRDALTIKL